MQDLVIIGVGGLGRECSQWCEDVNAEGRKFNVLGFLDDDTRKHGTTSHGLPILGGIDWLAARPHPVAAIVGVGGTPAKRRIVDRITPHVAGFPVLRHPRAYVGRFVELGDGTIVCPAAVLTTDIRIGRFVAINFGLTIGHDSQVADFVTLAPGVNLSGYTRVGEGADIGANAATIPGISIGAWSIVGAGSAVTRDVPPNTTVVGVPAKVIKTRAPGWEC